jgi:hypothetical protein
MRLDRHPSADSDMDNTSITLWTSFLLVPLEHGVTAPFIILEIRLSTEAGVWSPLAWYAYVGRHSSTCIMTMDSNEMKLWKCFYRRVQPWGNLVAIKTRRAGVHRR